LGCGWGWGGFRGGAACSGGCSAAKVFCVPRNCVKCKLEHPCHRTTTTTTTISPSPTLRIPLRQWLHRKSLNPWNSGSYGALRESKIKSSQRQRLLYVLRVPMCECPPFECVGALWPLPLCARMCV